MPKHSHGVGQPSVLGDDCWRVTLPDGKTLAVRGNGWRLANILPRDWQPLALTE